MISPPRLLAAPLAAALAVGLASSCMGSFTLTRKLYAFNTSITGNALINHLIFWAFVFVLPIYELALLGDGLILNVIEFWTGRNLLAADLSSLERDEDGAVRVARGDDLWVAAPVGDRRVEVRRNGALVGAVELGADGALLVSDAQGEIAVVPAAVLAAAAPALPSPLAAEAGERGRVR
jgi:hypothetical protein